MILLIAYGNSLRTDDAAGLWLADMIERACRRRQWIVERLTLHQLLPELVADVARADVEAVLFIDSRATPPEEPDPAVQVRPLAAEAIPLTHWGHHLTPATLLVFARELYRRQPPAWLVTAPGVDFSHGQGLSSTARRALARAEPVIVGLLDQLRLPQT